MYVCMCIYIYIYICIITYIHTCIPGKAKGILAPVICRSVQASAGDIEVSPIRSRLGAGSEEPSSGLLCVYIYICTHYNIYVYIYIYMYVCMYVCTYMYIYVYIYIYIYIVRAQRIGQRGTAPPRSASLSGS